MIEGNVTVCKFDKLLNEFVISFTQGKMIVFRVEQLLKKPSIEVRNEHSKYC